jgi:hypothetical protein
MSEERSDEREPGQHPHIYEQAEPADEPDSQDTNDRADDRVEVLQPDGDPVPVVDEKDEPRERDRREDR